MGPLLRLKEDSENLEQEIISSEQELSLCIKKLHLCFVIVNDPSMMFVSHLKPIIMVLLELHCRINFGVSHLKNPVEQIVQIFLRYSTKSMSLATLKAFILNIYDDSNDDRFKFKPMLEHYAFVPGEEGGIKAIGKSFKKERIDLTSIFHENLIIEIMKHNLLGLQTYYSELVTL